MGKTFNKKGHILINDTQTEVDRTLGLYGMRVLASSDGLKDQRAWGRHSKVYVLREGVLQAQRMEVHGGMRRVISDGTGDFSGIRL